MMEGLYSWLQETQGQANQTNGEEKPEVELLVVVVGHELQAQ